ncbi:MAG: hypothetical protein H6500_06080 [Candidatus Woesearchaeota archaeon]|nr:MAG: hypothetical protein H6500_06080 [Candidatus Woesearchaeota archaeon]
MGTFSRSWKLTKLSFSVIGKDKELLLFPLLSGVFSLLFLLALIVPGIFFGGYFSLDNDQVGALSLLIVFLLYFGLAFISTFFNTAVVYTTKKRFEGGNATFGESLSFVFSRIYLVFLWSVVSASVGLLLRLLEKASERLGLVGNLLMSVVISMFGFAWSLITLFVVPAMVYYDLTPFDAIKKSSDSLRKTWGEQFTRIFGLGAIQFVAFVLVLVFGFLLFSLLSPFGSAGVLTALGITGVLLLFVYLLFSVANAVFSTALFVYADKGKIPGDFDEEVLASSVAKK